MAKVLLLSLASALVTAQQPRLIQQSDLNQQATFNGPIQQSDLNQRATFNGPIQQSDFNQQATFNGQSDFNQQVTFNGQSDFNQQANFNGPSPIDPTISYNYGYNINDKDTGDSKTHQEALENGVLRGSYSVVQPDGKRRIVEYEADEVSGFQAKVRYESGYPIQTPSQRRPSAGGAASSQGSNFVSGSSSTGSSSRGSSSSRPSLGARFQGIPQGSRFTGGAAVQQPRFPAGTSQGPRFGPPGPTSQGAPARFIGGPPPQTSQFQGSRIPSQSPGHSSPSRFAGYVSQGRPSGSAGVSASQGSQFRPANFPGAPTGSSFIDASRPAGINSSRRPQGGAQGSRFSSGSSSQSGLVSSQNTFAPIPSQAGQSSSVFSGPGPLTQGISTGPRLQSGPPPSAPRPVAPGSPRPGALAIRRPGAPFSSQPNAQADVSVQIAPNGFFSQRGTPSSSVIAVQDRSAGASLVGLNGAAFGAASQAGINGAPSGAAAQAGFSGAAFQQDRSSSRFHSGAPSVSIQSSNPFQSGQGSRFAGGPAFDQLISSSS